MMTYLRSTALAVAFAATGIAGAPAAAQDEAGDRVNTVIIYGDDDCPPSTGETITVCARLDESERFRIPPELRQSGDPANTAWAQRVRALETVGEFGPMSCSPVGAGGELGCTADFIEAAYRERREGNAVRFSELIEAARAERLGGIDEEAEATQARVEALEEAYMERLRREQQGEPVSAVDPSAPPSEIVDPSRMPPQAPSAEPLPPEDDDGPRPIDASAPAQIGVDP